MSDRCATSDSTFLSRVVRRARDGLRDLAAHHALRQELLECATAAACSIACLPIFKSIVASSSR